MSNRTMNVLLDYSAHNGVTVEFVNDLDPKHPGQYVDALRLIRIMDGMSEVKTLSVIAHELGHAYFRDLPTIFSHMTKRQEARADEWAAHFLISHNEFRLAEEKYGSSTKWIAQELGVLERLIVAYERTLCRIGDTIYVKPNLGTAPVKLRA